MLATFAGHQQISIHALAKRATGSVNLGYLVTGISIHALAKRATSCIILTSLKLLIFQSTPSQRGRRQIPGGSEPGGIHFNPRPRKEGDTPYGIRMGMTGNFNPRPRKEGDDTRCQFLPLEIDFNPRPRKEGDAVPCRHQSRHIRISIHALAKRATDDKTQIPYIVYISIHALAKRATLGRQ